jgi:hypothetical protein
VHIRIGDIEIDGQEVRIGGSHPVPPVFVSQALVPQATPQPPAVTGSLKALPVRGVSLIRAGAVLFVAGILLFALAPPASILAFVLHVMPLTAGAGALGLGIMKKTEEARELQAARRRGEAELALHADRVRGALTESRPEQTVEWIAATLSLPEPTVVRVLDRLRKQGEIEEELNVDNGEWYYFAASRPDPVRGDLEARMAALEDRSTE